MYCSQKLYHTNEFGTTSKCDCLDAVHVVFGTVSILLTRQQCRDFARYIAEAVENTSFSVSDVNERCVYIPTRDDALLFALTFVELNQLDDLLHHTMLMMEVEDALTS